jgi:ATP-dependent RNA helicase DeaD
MPNPNPNPNPFSLLGVQQVLVQELDRLGIHKPTPIQEQTIPVILGNLDVIAQAQTGTGKTLAFILPILEKIDYNKNEIQALIVTPTRELALQISDEVKKLAPKLHINVLPVYGGQDVAAQMIKLKESVHLVIATPGRLLDHVRRATISLANVSMLVLDEADQMLHMGFLTEVKEVMKQVSNERQTMLFSATMPKQVRSLAKTYMKEPIDIRVQSKRITLDEIKQLVVETTDRAKQGNLISMLKRERPRMAIVFCRTKRRAHTLNQKLKELGFNAEELHGDLSQARREEVMKNFRDRRIAVLVATDVAARGLDVEGVTHVLNYDIPLDVEGYIHRIGRTGRAGEKGIAITFVAPKDLSLLQLIEKGLDQVLARTAVNSTAILETQSYTSVDSPTPKSESKRNSDSLKSKYSKRNTSGENSNVDRSNNDRSYKKRNSRNKKQLK